MDEPISRKALIIITIFIQSAVLLIASLCIRVGNIDLLPSFAFQNRDLAYGLLTGAATALISFLCLTVGKNLPLFGDLRKMSEEFLAPLMSRLNPIDMLLLSALAGFSEEVLFRGILQQQLGMAGASFLFGFVHDPTFKQKGYMILATFAGIALGYLYQWTGSLWSCVAAHTFHNVVSMLILKYYIKTSPTPSESNSNDLPE